jgi:hypothetical protein
MRAILSFLQHFLGIFSSGPFEATCNIERNLAFESGETTAMTIETQHNNDPLIQIEGVTKIHQMRHEQGQHDASVPMSAEFGIALRER